MLNNLGLDSNPTDKRTGNASKEKTSKITWTDESKKALLDFWEEEKLTRSVILEQFLADPSLLVVEPFSVVSL